MPDPRKKVKTLGEKETRDNMKKGKMPGFAEDTSKTNLQKDAAARVRKGGSREKIKADVLKMKASPEKKAAAKAKAIKGGMPENVANKVFKMTMGSKSAKNSDSTFSMYSEKVMQMSPLFAHDPNHPATPKNKLYSYEQTNTNVKRSGGGSESSNVQKKSTSNLANYQKGLKDLGPDFKPTPEQTAAANKKVAELKKKDAQNADFNKNTSKSNVKTVEKSVNKKTTVLGKQTQAEILAEGKEYKKNRKARLKAERGSAKDIAQKDSIVAAQNFINKQSKLRKTTQKTLDLAHKIGNLAGKKSLRKAKGKGGEVLFSPQETNEAFNVKSGNAIMKPKNPNKKVSKRNPRVKVGVEGPGSLGSKPKLSDLQMNIGDKALKYYNRKK